MESVSDSRIDPESTAAITSQYSEKELYDEVITNLSEEIRQGLTPTQAVDLIAVDKAAVPVEHWAAVRSVETDTIAENVSEARRVKRQSRGITVNDHEQSVDVLVTNQAGIEHTLTVRKTLTNLERCSMHELPSGFPSLTDKAFATRDAVDELQLVYTHNSSIEAYYVGDDGVESQMTLWYDGEPMKTMEPFDSSDQYGSAKAKADIIIWDADTTI